VNSFFHRYNFNAKIILIDDTFNLGKYFIHKISKLRSVVQMLHIILSVSCGEFYIGQTQRNLATRLNDHNPDRCKYQSTDVTKHPMENNGHYIDFENVTELFQASNWRKLLIKETLYICNKNNPNLILTNPPYLYAYLTRKFFMLSL